MPPFMCISGQITYILFSFLESGLEPLDSACNTAFLISLILRFLHVNI